jgi:hypothetical protein
VQTSFGVISNLVKKLSNESSSSFTVE